MGNAMKESRRAFLKTSAAGAAGIMVSSAATRFAAPAATDAWANGKQINPAIDNTRVVVAHDTQIFANQANTEAAMDKMAKALAQKTDAAAAWATIFQKPAGKASWADVIVGIKGGWCQQRAIAKICLELNRLGVQYSNIIYFDSNTSGVNCTGVDKYIPPLDKVKTSGPANSATDILHGLIKAPVPYKGVIVQMNCTTDVANGTIDLLVTTASDRDHGDAVGGATLTCKTLYGVFNAIDSQQYLHGNIGGNPDAITGMLSLQKSDAICGLTPPRQQLAVLSSVDRLLMGTFAPMVDWLCITKIRGPVEGKTYNATVVKRFYQDFGYTDAQVANLNLIDANSWVPSGTAMPKSAGENLRVQFIVSSPFFKLSMLDLDIPATDCIPMAISIMDQRGRLVRELIPRKEQRMMVAWDGKSDSGMRVPAGAYVIKVTNGESSAAGSIILSQR